MCGRRRAGPDEVFFSASRVADNGVIAEVRFLEPETSVSRRALLRGRRHFCSEGGRRRCRDFLQEQDHEILVSANTSFLNRKAVDVRSS